MTVLSYRMTSTLLPFSIFVIQNFSIIHKFQRLNSSGGSYLNSNERCTKIVDLYGALLMISIIKRDYNIKMPTSMKLNIDHDTLLYIKI